MYQFVIICIISYVLLVIKSNFNFYDYFAVQSSSSSMSPTPTPTPVVCSVENCVECDLSDAMCCRSCSTGYEVDNCACGKSYWQS